MAIELESRIEAFAEAAAELAVARTKIAASMEEELLELALEIAGAIVEREVERDHELHGQLARAALQTLGDPAHATLRASRDAYAAIVDAYDAPEIDVDGSRVTVTLDPSIDGLGCIAENDHARVDGRVSERLRAVRRAFDDERRRAQAEEGE